MTPEEEKQRELAIILEAIAIVYHEDECIDPSLLTGYELDNIRHTGLDFLKELLDKKKHEIEHDIKRGMECRKEELVSIENKIEIFEDME